MSEIRVNDIIGEDGSGAVGFSKGIDISSGIVTATTFDGNLTGDVTGNVTGNVTGYVTGTAGTFTSGIDVVGAAVTIHNAGIDVAGIVTATGGFSGNATSATLASGLSGTPNITVGTINATDITASGTVQYEDVVNVDSAGIGTFKGGIDVVGAAVTIHNAGIDITGVVTATSFIGDGANLTGVISGVEIRDEGSSLGYGATVLNFAGGKVAASAPSVGISTISVTGGISAENITKTNGQTAILDLTSYQDHKVTATGVVDVTCSGGTAGDSHSIRLVNSGIATVGFSTYFLWPGGSPPTIPNTSGSISYISFTIHTQGTAGIATQLLSGASINYS